VRETDTTFLVLFSRHCLVTNRLNITGI